MMVPKKLQAILVLAPLAYCAYQLGAALVKGYFLRGNSNGGGCVHRQKEPIQYWVKIILMAVFCVLGMWIVLIALGWSKI
jgi:hypothetical protein